MSMLWGPGIRDNRRHRLRRRIAAQIARKDRARTDPYADCPSQWLIVGDTVICATVDPYGWPQLEVAVAKDFLDDQRTGTGQRRPALATNTPRSPNGDRSRPRNTAVR